MREVGAQGILATYGRRGPVIRKTGGVGGQWKLHNSHPSVWAAKAGVQVVN